MSSAPSTPDMSPGLRGFLYITAGISGAAIMIIEILGAKILAPYLGTSHFVWTAQIAIALVSLAIGYYIGGTLADRRPNLSTLFVAIALAAVFVCFSTLVVEPVAFWALKFNLAAGSLLASLFLFFIPLSLLAITAPFLIRRFAHSLTGLGARVGKLSAISTIGSFLGTLSIGYFLIPYFRNSTIMLLTAGLLFLLSLFYFFGWHRGSKAVVIILFFPAALMAGGVLAAKKKYQGLKEIYFGNSNFGQLQVFETADGRTRYYLNDYLAQNTYDPVEKKSTSMFTYLLHGLARIYTPQINDVLCIGMGVGIVPMLFANEQVQVDVVEINPSAIPVAVKYFDCAPGRFNLVINDGRHFINRSNKKYDTIVLDAFLGDSSPSHLMSKEAFLEMNRLLTTNGTLVINSFVEFETGNNFFATALHKTLKSVFKSVRVHHNGNGNVFFVASNNPELKILRPYSLDQVHFAAKDGVRTALEGLIEVDSANGTLLTDDYNPVEFYDAKNRESLRRRLATVFSPG